MKKLFQVLLALLIVNVVFLSSCKEDTPEVVPPTAESAILTTYLAANSLDLNNVISSVEGNKFVSAPAAAADVAGKYIIDIRSAADFTTGHIEGAVNSTIANILTEAANAGDNQILVACYTGQTACYATALLRLYGYTEAQALKWGMSSWSATTDKWTPNIADSGDGELSTEAAPENTVYESPVLTTGETLGEEILKARVEAVVAEWGEATVSSANVVASPGDYFVNNYFSADHYVSFGHIQGAVRVSPLLISDESINYIDPSKAVVTYCYTGQTSAVITAYLRVLGYNAKSMLFGMNGLNTNNPYWTSGEVSNHWSHNANPKDFPLAQ